MTTESTENTFLEGRVILIDKPYTWTSFDVVKKVRYAVKRKAQVKKIKVGHAGTLDPLATGLLIICTGRFTKKIDELMGGVKVYTGTFKLGETTPSYDLESEADKEFETSHITKEMMEKAAKKMTGLIQQVPPVFSAKKIDGKRSYDLARAGKAVELKSREVEIQEFEIGTENFPEITFRIKCGKGTYIRSMAHDFGLALGSGAHLTSLRRESIGEYAVENALSPDDFTGMLDN